MRTADIDTVRLWCREQVPQPTWSRRRLEPLVTGRHIDLMDVRLGPDGHEAGVTFARLRYLNEVWTLYWRDGDGTFHLYRNFTGSPDVGVLLEFLAADPDPLFWAHEADG